MKKSYRVDIKPEECKGCERCITACSRNVLEMSGALNQMGHEYARYIGNGCIGCRHCYYTCPEPGAVLILERTDPHETNP